MESKEREEKLKGEIIKEKEKFQQEKEKFQQDKLERFSSQPSISLPNLIISTQNMKTNK